VDGAAQCQLPDRPLGLSGGGEYEMIMVSLENKEHAAHGVFGTIDPPNRLTLSWTWQHEGEMQGLATFFDLKFNATADGASELQLMHTMLPNDEMADAHAGGWQGAFECLEEYLAE
jgi:uncharacterized protein YndB with AHSA1/START domain